VQPDGCTLRQHLQSAARQTGIPDPRLRQEIPAHASTVWAAFVDLSPLNPIPPSEIAAWQQLHGVELTGWELDSLKAMDRKAAEVMAQQRREQA
jgi:hypothetical protein